MTELHIYRDDGPFAAWIGRKVRGAIPLDELQLTLLGAVPLVVVLGTAGRSLPAYSVGAGALAFVLLAGAGVGRSGGARLTWIVPPLLRALEYGFLITLTAIAQPDAMAFCFAFLGVLAFHHYDTVYRLRHQRLAPPSWVDAVGGGWDGRLLVASVLAPAGVLGLGLVIGAVGLALAYVTESTVSWLRFGRAERPAVYDDENEVLE